MDYDIAIVGGGISGLSALHFCRKFHPEKRVILLEKDVRCGGNIETIEQDGFLFENGPRSFLAKEPALAEMIEDLGLMSSLLPADASSKKRYIVKNALLEPVPMSPVSLFRSPLTGRAVLGEIVHEWREKTKSFPTETVAEFALRRWGKTIAETFVGPMVSGVFAGDAERLEIGAAFPRLVEIEKEHQSVMKGLLFGKKKKGPFEGLRSSRLLSFSQGMSALPNALAAEFPDALRTSAEVVGIEKSAEGWSVSMKSDSLEVKELLLASPFEALLKWFPDAPRPEKEVLAYPPLLVLHLGFKEKAHNYEGFGFLAPVKESLRSLGVLLNDQIFPGLAHQGSSLTIMAGGMRSASLREEDLPGVVETLIEEQRKLLGLQGSPSVSVQKFYPHSIPQYNRGTSVYRTELESWSQKKGLDSIGNFIGGVGVNDCVRTARTWASLR